MSDQLKRVVELQHGGRATWLRRVRLLSGNTRPDTWDGWVHVFNLSDNPNSKVAYAWAAPISGGTAPRYFAVLQSATVTDPIQAVKAAATAIQNNQRR